MATATRIIRLDIVSPQTQLAPICAIALHLRQFLVDLLDGPFKLALDHDSGKVSEPVKAELGVVHGVDHRVRVAAFDLAVEHDGQAGEESGGDFGGGGEGDERAVGGVAEEEVARCDLGWEAAVWCWVWWLS